MSDHPSSATNSSGPMTRREIAARLRALSKFPSPEKLGADLDVAWRQACRQAADYFDALERLGIEHATPFAPSEIAENAAESDEEPVASRNAVIEECAEVADEFNDPERVSTIVEAIRALKSAAPQPLETPEEMEAYLRSITCSGVDCERCEAFERRAIAVESGLAVTIKQAEAMAATGAAATHVIELFRALKSAAPQPLETPEEMEAYLRSITCSGVDCERCEAFERRAIAARKAAIEECAQALEPANHPMLMAAVNTIRALTSVAPKPSAPSAGARTGDTAGAERLAQWLEKLSAGFDPVGPEYLNAAALLRTLDRKLRAVDGALDNAGAPVNDLWEGVNTKLSRVGRILRLGQSAPSSALETGEERRLRHRLEKIDAVLDQLGAPKSDDWDGIHAELSQVGRILRLTGFRRDEDGSLVRFAPSATERKMLEKAKDVFCFIANHGGDTYGTPENMCAEDYGVLADCAKAAGEQCNTIHNYLNPPDRSTNGV